MAPTESVLRQRLERVQALHDGATTPGERRAAERARDRLIRRLEAVRDADPVARFVRDHVAAYGVARAPEPPSVDLPSTREVLSVLARWEAGEIDDEAIGRWAADLVGAVDLPSHPDALGAARAEVLLQLAMLDRVPLRRWHVTRIRRFLRSRDWADWFQLLVAVSSGRGS